MINGLMILKDTNLIEIFDKHHLTQNFNEILWLSNNVEKVIANNDKPSAIIEIGVDAGGSFKIWEQILSLSNNLGKKNVLIGVDIGCNLQWDKTKSDITVEFVVGNSHDINTLNKVKKILADNNIKDEKIDFVFIDGEHNPRAARQDFFMYGGLVRQGGIVGFHDYHDVKGFLDTLDSYRLEVFEDKPPYDKKYRKQGIGTAIYHV